MLPFTRPSLDKSELDAVREVLESGWITSGPKVKEFESALADYIGGDINVLVFNSATSALEAVLLAADIGPGDEVIVPAMSFVATANVVVRVGARPVFVDVDLVSRNINIEKIEAAITDKTRAIIPVHFAGRSVELESINAIAKAHNLLVIEDAAQAIGSKHQDKYIGSSGNPVCFSFHPNKNITTIEGGAVACRDNNMIERLLRLRFHGIVRDDDGNMDVPEWGGKMNLPDVGAALGLVQLQRLEQFNTRRRELAQLYLQHLPAHPALVLPGDAEGHSWHMFCVCVDFEKLGTSRAEVQQQLQEQDIGTGIHYPAMHLFSMYRKMGYNAGDFPVAEQIGTQTLTLPLFPGMKNDDVLHVCHALQQVLDKA